MKRTILIALLGLIHIASGEIDRSLVMSDAEISSKDGDPSSPRGAAAQHRSLAAIRSEIAKVDSLPKERAIEFLGEVVRKTSMFNIYQVSERFEVYDMAQAKLLAIPGHATYFRDQIKEAEAKVREGEMTLSSWDNLLMDATETLAHLPSEETVGVLRELGKDRFGDPNSPDPAERDPTGNGPRDPFSDSSYPVPSSSAFTALTKLGIEGLPTGRPNAEGVTWTAWWQEVSSGKRKYRFKGSDVWHPVESPAKAPSAAGETRPERRPDLTGATPSGGSTPSPKDSPGKPPAAAKSSDPWFWPTIAAFGAVFGLLGYLLLRKPA